MTKKEGDDPRRRALCEKPETLLRAERLEFRHEFPGPFEPQPSQGAGNVTGRKEPAGQEAQRKRQHGAKVDENDTPDTEHCHEHKANFDAGHERERHEDDVQDGRAKHDEDEHIDIAGPHLEGEEVREPRYTVVQEKEDAQEEDNPARELGVSPGSLDVCGLCHGCCDKEKEWQALPAHGDRLFVFSRIMVPVVILAFLVAVAGPEGRNLARFRLEAVTPDATHIISQQVKGDGRFVAGGDDPVNVAGRRD